jgi:hypothetical protein
LGAGRVLRDMNSDKYVRGGTQQEPPGLYRGQFPLPCKPPRPVLGPTEPPTGSSSPEVQRACREVDLSLSSSAAVENGWRCASAVPYAFVAYAGRIV